jgi:hypothetical protein
MSFYRQKGYFSLVFKNRGKNHYTLQKGGIFPNFSRKKEKKETKSCNRRATAVFSLP